jgi:transcriptional regulator with XRE-family HTH domain
MARKKPSTVSISDQLREAIRACGTTRYALARQLGISQSTLSRFVSGERGLTLDVVDKLADVLGLQIVVTVGRAERPRRRGPKPRREKTVDTQTKAEWDKRARYLAQHANEIHFSSRRGIWRLDDVNKLCIFNNNPYEGLPELRDQETAVFRRWLATNGIKVLAYAMYPETGEDAGYTYAMILDAGADREREIVGAFRRIVDESLEKLYGRPRKSE